MVQRGRTLGSVIGSPRFATGLMVYLGVLSVLGTLVPQGASGDPKVAMWVSSHRAVEPLVALTGFHNAFTSVPYLIGAALLAASTTVCAWRRTKVARSRAALLTRARKGDVAALLDKPDTKFAVQGTGDDSDILDVARTALAGTGVRVVDRGDCLVGASSPLSTVGSPVFHWSLVLLLVTVAVGGLGRAGGLMGIPVGDVVPDQPDSYKVKTVGPLHNWSRVHRSIGVESFELNYVSEGINRGGTPTVIVQDGNGVVVARGRVYPNHPLRYHALTIHPSNYGLAPRLALIDADGHEIDRSSPVVDFSDETSGGTAPTSYRLASDLGPQDDLIVAVSVPLDRKNDAFVHAIPSSPTVIASVATQDGQVLAHGTLSPGGDLVLPGGQRLRLIQVGWYARLLVVDDWTVPGVYLALVGATIGLCLTFLLRQQLVVVSLADAPGGRSLKVTARVWGGGGVIAKEIRTALREAVGANKEESAQ